MINVIIIEDEKILRNGIATLINWSSLNCNLVLSADNPLPVLEYLKTNHVDLIITDIEMPNMSGLELVEILNIEYPSIGVIILTAYANFEYAKKAIQFNVLQYILKTDFVNDLPKAIEKANLDILSKNKLDKSTNLDSKFFKNILSGAIDNELLTSRWLSSQNITLDNYFMVIGELDATEYVNFNGENPLLLHSTENFLNLSFTGMTHHTMALDDNLILIIISFNSPNENKNLLEILLSCNEIVLTTNDYLSFNINLAISQQHNSYNSLVKCFNEAKQALSYLYSNSNVCTYKEMMAVNSNSDAISIQPISNKILELILEKDDSSMLREIEKVFQLFEKSRYNHELVQIKLLNLITLCFVNLSSYNIELENSPEIQKQITRQIMKSNTSVFALKRITLDFFANLIQSIKYKKSLLSPVTKEVIQYLNTNFMEKITLDDLSKLTNSSKSYISRIYKKETGLSIIAYLTDLRIKKSQEFLTSTNMNVSEIAYALGFSDPAYFTNVFTKTLGVSPKQYQINNK